MNVLCLDDSTDRIKTFRRHFPHGRTFHDADSMILALGSSGASDLLFLDYDLDDHGLADTGMKVVEWIVANRPKIDKIIVHSRNGHASPMMTSVLRAAGYYCRAIPFFDIKWDSL